MPESREFSAGGELASDTDVPQPVVNAFEFPGDTSPSRASQNSFSSTGFNSAAAVAPKSSIPPATAASRPRSPELFAQVPKLSIPSSERSSSERSSSERSSSDRSSVAAGDGVARFVTSEKIRQVSQTTVECDVCEVQPDDNYWTISRRAYGTARYFSSLALYNQQRIPDPKKLRPGMKVLIPAPQILEQKYPELFEDQQPAVTQPRGFFLQADGTPAYRVGERETLSEISQKHLGRASRWIQIYRMNQNILKDPNILKPGTVIALPNDANDVHLVP
ncbi:MAG: LysM peptidoglycan-binding domain-containing protein [Planctomycetaceae bacterium]